MSCPSFCREPDCTLPYGKHMSFHIAAAARPTSGRSLSVQRIDQKEAEWSRDGDAYKRLRHEGLQPPKIDGSHNLERDAKVPEQIEFGSTRIKPSSFKEFEDRAGHSALTPAQDAA